MRTVHVLAVVLLAGSAVSGKGGVTNVTAGGPLYATITQAVAAAGANARLLVSTGLYAEAVTISDKTIAMEGGYMASFGSRTNLATWTVITPGNTGRAVTISNRASVVLEGLSVTGGVVFGSGGGVYVDKGCVLTAVVCRIMENQALFGGGICVRSNAWVVLTNTWVANNDAWMGGGVQAEISGRVTARGTGTLISGNTAQWGGGVGLFTGAATIEDGAWVCGNTALDAGGGVWLGYTSRLEVHGSGTRIGGFWILFNQVTNRGKGGGIWAGDSEVVVSGQCAIAHNYATDSGGGVFLSNSTMHVIDGACIGDASGSNQADGDGGGVYLYDSTLMLMNGARIMAGYAATNGGGVMAQRSLIVGMENVQIGSTNSANGNRALNGGGVYLWDSTAVFTRVELCGNTAANVGGGAAGVGASELVCVDVQVAGNCATNCGGMVFSAWNGGAWFDHCMIVSNIARGTVGGIAYNGLAGLQFLNDTKLMYNQSESMCGGLLLIGSAARCENVEIAHNRAGRDGGAVYGMADAVFTAVDTDIHDNHADNNGTMNGMGGAVYSLGGTVQLQARTRSCGMQANTAVHGGGMYAAGTRIMCEAAPPYVLTLGANMAATNGGWLYASTGVTATVAGNVLLEGNQAFVAGGAVMLTNCVLEVYASNGAAPMVYGNVAELACGGLMAQQLGARLALRGVCLMRNVTKGTLGNVGGGALVAGAHSRLEASDCLFYENVSSNLGGAILVNGGAEHVAINSTFSTPAGVVPAAQFRGNHAHTHGGALCVTGCSELDIDSALMLSNSAGLSGGAILFAESYTGRIVNTIFTRNSGGGLGDAIGAGDYALLELQQCTIADNHSNGVAHLGGVGEPLIENCIVWGHSTSQILGTATVRFSDIEGGYPGLFNLSANPVFFAPEALRYDVTESSPCIDKGATLFTITNDCIGTVRPYGAGWDMGAYEFVPEPGVAGLLGMALLVYNCRRRARR